MTRRHFKQNCGGGLLGAVYGDSPLAALRDYMPRRTWYPWLLRSTPQHFWKDIRNRRAFMAWLAEELGIQRTEGWYGVTKQDFHDYGGAGLLQNYYHTAGSASFTKLPEADSIRTKVSLS